MGGSSREESSRCKPSCLLTLKKRKHNAPKVLECPPTWHKAGTRTSNRPGVAASVEKASRSASTISILLPSGVSAASSSSMSFKRFRKEIQRWPIVYVLVEVQCSSTMLLSPARSTSGLFNNHFLQGPKFRHNAPTRGKAPPPPAGLPHVGIFCALA